MVQRLNEPEAKKQFNQKVLENCIDKDNVQEWWTANSTVMRRAAEETLGRISGKKAPADKEAWSWNDEVQNAVRRKKELKKGWDDSGGEGDKTRYQKAAKREVAEIKNRVWDELYEELETPEEEKKLSKCLT